MNVLDHFSSDGEQQVGGNPFVVASREEPKWMGSHSEGLSFFFAVLFTLLLISIELTVGDWLLTKVRPDWIAAHIWAVVDAPIHAILAMIIALPLAMHGHNWRDVISRLALAGIASSLIDIDHFVAARSFSLYAATHLPYRPETHSVLFAFISGLAAWRITREWQAGLLVLLGMNSHFLRDASVGSIPFLLWPFNFQQLSVTAYYSAEIGLSIIAWTIAKLKFNIEQYTK